jgi:hypothetical protein
MKRTGESSTGEICRPSVAELSVICNASADWARAIVGIAIFLSLAGCNKSNQNLAPVSGRVTLDGKPQASTKVIFQPDGEKSPSMGRTDNDGRYQLGYKRGVEGGMVGWNTVRIETATAVTHGPQLIPARYNDQSELRREVKPGKNTFDFELKTEK